MSKLINEDIRFHLLKFLEHHPDHSQREIAKAMGTSLGAANFLLQALVDEGQIKVRSFRASDNKLRYAYILTPIGLDTKARLATGFLKRKFAEYQALKAEIDSTRAEITPMQDRKIWS
jgi:EPS-associated MarR family transcriptional regulator